MGGAEPAAKGDTVEIGQGDVEDGEVRFALGDGAEGLLAGGCGFDVVTLRGQKAFDVFKQESVVVDDEEAGVYSAPPRGRRIVKVLPTIGLRWAVMVPPCSSAMRLQL